MKIDLTAAEIARLCRLLHLANDASDAELWEKLKDAHAANHTPVAHTAADEYQGDDPEVRQFLSAFEV
jgi:hypothetical protein